MSDPILRVLEEGFVLTPQERSSALWRRLEEQLQKRLTQLRARNDGPHDPAETARLRGHIAALKQMIALGKEPESPGEE